MNTLANPTSTASSLSIHICPNLRTQRRHHDESVSSFATPAGKGGKKHLSTLAVAFEKVLAEEAEEALVASMPSVASTTDEYSKRVGTRASRRTPTAGSQNKTDKFSHRTHQTWQKPLAKLPRADLVMRNVERSITLGDPVVLPSKAQHHATTVLLKHG